VTGGELVDFLVAPLGQGFVRRALAAGLALGAAGAVLGVFVVQRGLGLIADGLAHATFGGLALGLLLGATPDRAIWVALPFTLLVALGIQQLRRRTTLGGDVATGIFFSVSFDAGVLFLGLRGPTARPVNVEALLFGSLLAVSPEALWAVLALSLAVLALLLRVGPELAYATFDPELARLSGVRVHGLESLLVATTALFVVVGAKTVGVVLVAAFVVIPAAAAQLAGRALGATLLLSVGASLFATALGLFASYHLNVATGATIILTLGVLFFLAFAVSRR
jgi:zinc transport system permease protein